MDYTTPIFDRLQDCWDPISEDQLCRLEDDLEADFPKDYREFLLRFNAGRWSHVVKSRALRSNRLDDVGITSSYGIIPDDRFTGGDILDNAKVYSGRIPENLVPIMDAGGAPVCTDLSEENYGKIYYWDRSGEGIERDERANLIADSFAEFLLTLTPYTEVETFCEELPVFQAAERGDRKAVLDYLIDRGKPDIRNDKGWTLLMCAARNSWPKIVEMLYNGGANPNALDPDGWSPLHHAVWGQSLDSVNHLLAAEADTDYRDSRGLNLAQIAKHLGYYRLYYHLAPYMPYPLIECFGLQSGSAGTGVSDRATRGTAEC